MGKLKYTLNFRSIYGPNSKLYGQPISFSYSSGAGLNTIWGKPQTGIYNSDADLFEVITAIELNSSDRYEIAVAKTTTGYCAELTKKATGETHICNLVLENNEIKIFQAVVADPNVFSLSTMGENHKGTVITAVIWDLLKKDTEFKDRLATLMKYLGNRDYYNVAAEVCVLSNNIYYRVQKRQDTTVLLPSTYGRITQSMLASVEVTETISVAPLKYFKEASRINRKSQIINPTYSFILDENRTYTETEKSLLVTMPSYYVEPPLVATISRYIKDSRQYTRKINNVLLQGPAGSGKSTIAPAIAEKLGLPFVIQTFGPDTQDLDLIGRLIPNVKTEDENSEPLENLVKKEGIPTFQDVENDFEGSFEKLFNKKPGRLSSPADCYSEICNRLIAAATKQGDYTFVPSPLIQALKNGWLVELQEPTVIKRASVLVALNGLMENDTERATIQLPTGERINRHKDAVVIMTTNMNYEGCKGLQQSVLSRLQIVRSVSQPTAETMADRVEKILNFGDKKALEKMSNTIKNINVCQVDNDITDGITGPRELLDWAEVALIISKAQGEATPSEEAIIKAAFSTILSKCSQNEEDRETILSSFKILYPARTVDELKSLYETGAF